MIRISSLKDTKFLVTGGAGFIGSNLVKFFLKKEYKVVCLDNLSTGYEHNIEEHYGNPNFNFIKGDIRDLKTCKRAVQGCQYVSHQAALGSVPRSIEDPLNTNSVNITGFLNMLTAARDEGVKRFVYAASSSTYGDSKKLPKIEDEIGSPLSPYAVTKYVNELYADVYAKVYGMKCIGLRYFNVFGMHQDPNGAYAAVIPLWVKQLLNYESPTINGDGSYSRDFTYIDNVIQANNKATFAPFQQMLSGQREYYNIDLDFNKYQIPIESTHDLDVGRAGYFSEVFNIAYGGNTTLLELYSAIQSELAKYDAKIGKISPILGPNRLGDIPHSQASILKAKEILGYEPLYNAREGFKMTVDWYINNIS
jgi:UDP-N-acetylglucosamine/UDP-N-acetylgalactosamine 4-epimerase